MADYSFSAWNHFIEDISISLKVSTKEVGNLFIRLHSFVKSE